jgi:hypothetical protein
MDDEKFDKLLQILAAPQQWKAEQASHLLQQTLSYSQYLQSQPTFARLRDRIRQSIHPPDKAQELSDHFLSLALSSNIHRRVLLAVVQSYVRFVPDGTQRARHIISNHIRDCSVNDLLCEASPPEFNVYLIAANFLNGRPNSSHNRPTDLSRGAAKAIIKNPSLFGSLVEVIGHNFTAIDPDDAIALALSSADGMKFVLSQLAPLILAGNLQAYEMIQRIAAAGRRGEPACLVADLLKQNHGISCLMRDSSGI